MTGGILITRSPAFCRVSNTLYCILNFLRRLVFVCGYWVRRLCRRPFCIGWRFWRICHLMPPLNTQPPTGHSCSEGVGNARLTCCHIKKPPPGEVTAKRLAKVQPEHVIRVVVAISVATIATAGLAISPVPVPISTTLLASLCTVMAPIVTAFYTIMTTLVALLPARLIIVPRAVLYWLHVRLHLNDLRRCE